MACIANQDFVSASRWDEKLIALLEELLQDVISIGDGSLLQSISWDQLRPHLEMLAESLSERMGTM